MIAPPCSPRTKDGEVAVCLRAGGAGPVEGGMDITRDISQGEKVEKELDIFITRRHEGRRKSEGERLEEELWRESERRHETQRREENRAAWCEHFQRMRTLHWGLADEYDAKLKELENGHGDA